jgi:hypothetical protein
MAPALRRHPCLIPAQAESHSPMPSSRASGSETMFAPSVSGGDGGRPTSHGKPPSPISPNSTRAHLQRLVACRPMRPAGPCAHCVEAIDRCPRRGYICCAAPTARFIRVGRAISSADLRAIEPAPRVATRQAGYLSSSHTRCRCPTDPPRAARRHASNACRGPTSSGYSTPLMRQREPVLRPDGRRHKPQRRVRSPTASDA